LKKDEKSKPVVINQISKVLAENLKKTDGLSNIKKKWEERKNKYIEDIKNKENDELTWRQNTKTLTTKKSAGNLKGVPSSVTNSNNK